MSDVKIGTVAYLITTAEPAFVLDIRAGNPVQRYESLSGKVAVVRRPVDGEDGIRHSIEYFALEELETLEAGQNRRVSEIEELKARFPQSDRPAVGTGIVSQPN